MMGLDGIYADIMKKDFASELQKTNKQQGELADMVDKSADSVHRLSNEFSRTWETSPWVVRPPLVRCPTASAWIR